MQHLTHMGIFFSLAVSSVASQPTSNCKLKTGAASPVDSLPPSSSCLTRSNSRVETYMKIENGQGHVEIVCEDKQDCNFAVVQTVDKSPLSGPILVELVESNGSLSASVKGILGSVRRNADGLYLYDTVNEASDMLTGRPEVRVGRNGSDGYTISAVLPLHHHYMNSLVLFAAIDRENPQVATFGLKFEVSRSTAPAPTAPASTGNTMSYVKPLALGLGIGVTIGLVVVVIRHFFFRSPASEKSKPQKKAKSRPVLRRTTTIAPAAVVEKFEREAKENWGPFRTNEYYDDSKETYLKIGYGAISLLGLLVVSVLVGVLVRCLCRTKRVTE